MIDSGKLRHRITLQTPANTRDPATGAVVKGWADVATVWASIEPLSAREFIAAQAEQSAVTARITIRHRPGITRAMRIVHGDKVYNIEGVLADRESGLEYLTLPVSEGVNSG